MMPKTSKLNNPGAIIQFDSLGTRWWVELLGQDNFPTELADIVRCTVELFDDNYSRFKQDSLIGHLNTHKRLLGPPQELLDMFTFAHKMHTVTDGAFDISVGGTLQRLGYGDTKTATHAKSDFWSQVKYDRGVIVIPGESAIDFGGFGKGWLLDKLAVLLERRGCKHYLINGGGDIVLNSTLPIELGLEHPYDPTKVIGTTKITKGSLAVSSTVKRRWSSEGASHHHIIEPDTDAASNSAVVTTYVRGKTALIADTLATVLVLRPELRHQLEKTFKIKAIIVTNAQIL